MSIEHYQPGLAITRFVIARSLNIARGESRSPTAAKDLLAMAQRRWGPTSMAVSLCKSAVAGGGSGLGAWGSELADVASEAQIFLDAVRPRTILGKMQGLRRVPKNTPFARTATGATAYWTGQGRAARLSAGAFQRDKLAPLSLIGIQVLSQDLLEDSSPEAEEMVRSDLSGAVVELSDLSFIDPTSAGVTDEMPASISYGAPSFAATGDLADDCERALSMLEGTLETAVWVMHPRLAASIGLRSAGRGVAADLGARGGSLAGLPVLTSEAVPFDSDNGSIILVDAGGVLLLDDGLRFSHALEDAIEMSDAPTGDAMTPTGATSLVSLWQTESAAIKIVRRINWQRAREAGVVVITAAAYAAS